MFFNAPPNPTPTKHIIYLVASSLLGIFLSLLIHAVAESLYLNWATDTGHHTVWYGGCALHPIIQIGLLILGAVGGYSIGRLWWRMVYLDRIWTNKIDSQTKNNPPTRSHGQ
ncbi:MAG: hypothetical protein V1668_02355 [Patescibacteria group bacterium]